MKSTAKQCSSANILLATFLTNKSNDETSLRHVKAQSPRKCLETRNQGSVKKKSRSLESENTSGPPPGKDGHKTGSPGVDMALSLSNHKKTLV